MKKKSRRINKAKNRPVPHEVWSRAAGLMAKVLMDDFIKNGSQAAANRFLDSK